jgi:cytochrome c-type biogenesis protein CcmH
MTLFWLIGAALAAGVLAWLLRPLLARRQVEVPSRKAANVAIYRDQLRELGADLAAGTLAREDYDRARAELESRLLQDVARPDEKAAMPAGRRAVWALAAALPLASLAAYLVVGTPSAIVREAEQRAEQQVTPAQVEAMVERLAARLRENPEDANGWKLLGRSYGVMGRYTEAADAYARAAVRAPRDAQLLADFADVLAMARGQSLQGEPEQLVLRALEIEPHNLKALALAGSAAFERKDFAAAASYWERMLAHVEPGSEDARAIQQNVAEARALQSREQKPPPVAGGVRGTVSLAPTLKEKAAPDDTVFVFARAADGPPMPLAVARVRVRDLPFRFLLDDSMAMSPAMKLSAFPRVVVAARVSKSGTATAQPGDLQGASAPVSNDDGAVNVVIDSLVR